ncbi:helix-turn-helix domain-containing protein [Pseudomonas aeruginosa]
MPENSLGARLREERERLGFTQPAFAALVGAAKRTQIGWEQGRTAPDAAALSIWASHGMDVLYVVTGMRSDALPIPKMDPLSRREQALISNYRGSSEEGRRAIEGAASGLAHGRDQDRGKGGK